MLSDYALFQTINTLRKVAATEPEDEVGFNIPMIRLFDAGFATIQANAIRRLIEKPQKRPHKAVISIPTILEDVKDNLKLITRENYVCYDGLPYDYEEVRAKLDANSVTSGGSMPSRGPNAWLTSEMAHNNFDRLAQIEATNRSRNDCIAEEVINCQEAKLIECENIQIYVNKFIAHAAHPENRKELTDEQKNLTLGRLKRSIILVYQVTSFLSSYLLFGPNLGGVPTPQYNHLENLDKRWVSPKNIGKARKIWDEVVEEVSHWHSVQI
jgi:hypothetical protein